MRQAAPLVAFVLLLTHSALEAAAPAAKEAKPKTVHVRLVSPMGWWHVPSAGRKAEDMLTLRIANGTDKDHWFNMAGTIALSLHDAEGNLVKAQAIPDRIAAPTPIRIHAMKWKPVHFQVHVRTPAGGGNPQVTLTDTWGGKTTYKNLPAGRYTLRATYANAQARMGRLIWRMNEYKELTARTPLWVGRAVARPIEISLSAKPPQRKEALTRPE